MGTLRVAEVAADTWSLPAKATRLSCLPPARSNCCSGAALVGINLALGKSPVWFQQLWGRADPFCDAACGVVCVEPVLCFCSRGTQEERSSAQGLEMASAKRLSPKLAPDLQPDRKHSCHSQPLTQLQAFVSLGLALCCVLQLFCLFPAAAVAALPAWRSTDGALWGREHSCPAAEARFQCAGAEQ